MHTYASALDLIGVTVPDHLAADATVPILTGPQAQGDLLVMPIGNAPEQGWQPLPEDGVQLIRGEATGNTHWLHRGFDSPDVTWQLPAPPEAGSAADDDSLVVAQLQVPAGQSALLIHTDEHGANGIGPGSFAIRRKRERRFELIRTETTANDPLYVDYVAD